VELNILNSLIGSKDIEAEFESLVARYPETLKCVPLLWPFGAMKVMPLTATAGLCIRFAI
jgi:type II restriction enzyme